MKSERSRVLTGFSKMPLAALSPVEGRQMNVLPVASVAFLCMGFGVAKGRPRHGGEGLGNHGSGMVACNPELLPSLPSR